MNKQRLESFLNLLFFCWLFLYEDILFCFQPNHERVPVDEMQQAEEQGSFTFVHGLCDDDDDAGDDFEQAPDTTEQSVRVSQEVSNT